MVRNLPLKQLKFFYKNSYKIILKTTTTKKQKTDVLNFACRLMNEYQMTKSYLLPKVNYRLLILV